MQSSFYAYISDAEKVRAFDVIDYFSVNRKAFDGMTFTEAFRKLYDALRRPDLDDSDLARAIDTALTLEQRRVNSYRPGNLHIEEYSPGTIKPWQEYIK